MNLQKHGHSNINFPVFTQTYGSSTSLCFVWFYMYISQLLILISVQFSSDF